MNDVLRVEGEIAATIARTLRRQLSGEEKAKLVRGAAADPEAYRLHLKGRDFLVGNQQEMDKSVRARGGLLPPGLPAWERPRRAGEQG